MILFWILRAVYEELGECDFKFESTFFFVLERSMMMESRNHKIVFK